MALVYREHAPDAPLKPFVECLWSATAGAAVREHVVPPDGCVDIIFTAGGRLDAVGTMTTRQHFTLPAGAEVTGIRFRPGRGRAFLRVPPGKLTDLQISLHESWGAAAAQLQRQLEDAGSLLERLALLASAARAVQTAVTPLQRAISAIGAADLDAVADQAGLSPRQFRRRCLEESGLTPKHLARVLRFRLALRKIDAGQCSTGADLAAECGYYDQAHFIHDFREFQGCTPGEYASALTDEP